MGEITYRRPPPMKEPTKMRMTKQAVERMDGPMKESTPCTAASTSKGIITVAQMRRNHPRPN